MKKLLLLTLIAVWLCGCAGKTARQKVLCPAIQDGWQLSRTIAVNPEPMDDAVVDCACPDLYFAWLQTEFEFTGDSWLQAAQTEQTTQLGKAIEKYCRIQEIEQW